MEAARLSRKNLRPQLLSGKSQGRGGCPLGEGWLKEKWPELLDAHFRCKEPGEAACLQDALSMTFSGKPKSAEKDEEKESRTLSALKVQVIKEWYDKKVKDLENTRGLHF